MYDIIPFDYPVTIVMYLKFHSLFYRVAVLHLIHLKSLRRRRLEVIKTGTTCHLFMQMDNFTLQRHIRFDLAQFSTFVGYLIEMGHDETDLSFGGKPRISIQKKGLVFLWYMANNNSFREMSDKFNITQSSVYRIIKRILNDITYISSKYIKWPTPQQKLYNARKFLNKSGQRNVIGVIDGCHIKIQKPSTHGDNYLNRKGYFSLLLQGVCDWKGSFTHVYVGPPGSVHDARVLRKSEIATNSNEMLGFNWKLLGDSAYIGNDFHYIITPKRDNGALTPADIENNKNISKGRVIIENAFGMLKCRFRRLRDVQNTNLENIVRVILAACTLHCMLLDDGYVCPQHPMGCPRDDDEN